MSEKRLIQAEMSKSVNRRAVPENIERPIPAPKNLFECWAKFEVKE